MLTYTCHQMAELSAVQRAAWVAIVDATPALESPYFRPEFSDAVAAVRDDVQVTVIADDGEPRGFFPFQRDPFGQGSPVGGRLSDFHAVIAPPELDWKLDELLAACGLVAFDFHHLLATQSQFKSCHSVVEDSPLIDVSEGFEAYRAGRRAAGSEELQHTLRKERKLEREVGPISFCEHTDSGDVFDQLIAWKQQQYAASGMTDLFGFAWTRKLLEQILAAQSPEFRGRLATLHVGERLVAVHLGMQSGAVLHSWFPAYDHDLSKYSPGLILLANLAKHAAAAGIRRIDLGRGDEQFKRSLGTGKVLVAEGTAELQSVVTLARQCWRTTRDWAKASPMWGAVHATTGWLRGLKDWMSFR